MSICFDGLGNPFPYSILTIDLKEFSYFSSIPDTTVRVKLFNSLLNYISDFDSSILPQNWTQWFGGSYTTSKINPNDIDLVNIIDCTSAINAVKNTKQFFTDPKKKLDSRVKYSVDAYLIPQFDTSDGRYSITVDRMNYWEKWFGHDRNNNPKAVIRVIHR